MQRHFREIRIKLTEDTERRIQNQIKHLRGSVFQNRQRLKTVIYLSLNS